MNTEHLRPFRQIDKKKTVNFEGKLVTFLIFLVITTVIWLFSVLRKEYTTDFVVPVDIVNLDNDLIPVSAGDNNVLVKIRSTGFGLLQFLYSKQDYRLKIDARNLINKRSIKTNLIHLGESSWYFIESFKKLFGNEVQIISVLPDSFIVEYTRAQSKMVPVKYNVDFQVPRQYVQVVEPLVFPDSVLVTGPFVVLDTMTYCLTVKTDLGIIQSDTSFPAGIDLPYNFRVKPEKVMVRFTIDRYSEKTFSVSPVLLNVPEDIEVIIIPEKVDVRTSVALKYFDKINEHDITLYADFSKHNDKNNFLELELGKMPVGVFNPVIYPPQIEFLIKK